MIPPLEGPYVTGHEYAYPGPHSLRPEWNTDDYVTIDAPERILAGSSARWISKYTHEAFNAPSFIFRD
ncbi:MAG: hypothetical protein E6R11_00415 [Rhodocyclaceae bacterium]|nr:MAG: hypothetical protein E6R11_00415 [Rhodocyclaceae bacterium]